MGSINDVITGQTPQFWNGVDLQFELAFFWGAQLLDISDYDSVTVDLKMSSPTTGLPVMSGTLASGSLNPGLTLSAWNGGNPTDCHALVAFAQTATELVLSAPSVQFWLAVSALTSDSPAHRVVLGATPLNVVESGAFIAPPASVVNPAYYTAAQSDARYAMAVNLTTINSDISTLQSQMTSVTTSADAAMPKAGGTFSGGITITGLSGVLKAPSGVLTGGANTDDLPEGGTNQYCSTANWNNKLSLVWGASHGVCPLDTSSLVPTAYLPPLAVCHVFSVASQAAMLALSAVQGDIAIRTDIGQTFVLTNSTPTVLGNWAQILCAAGGVTSVNSLTGAVTLTSTNIAEGANLYYTSARAMADALTATLTGFSSAGGGTVSSADTILSALGKFENRMALNDAKVTGAGALIGASGGAIGGALTFYGGTNPGIVLSNLTDTQRAALTPGNGMLIYDTTLSQLMFYNGAWSTVTLAGGQGQWVSGPGAPSGTLGANGSYYLDTTSGAVHLKTAGTWSTIWSALGLFGSVWTSSITNSGQNFNIGSSGASAGLFTLTNDPAVTGTANNIDLVLAGGYVQALGLKVGGNLVVNTQTGGFSTIYASPASFVQSQGVTSTTTGLDNEARRGVDAVISVLHHHGLMANP